MKTRTLFIAALIMMVCSCKSAGERWLNGMANFKELNGKWLSLKLLKMPQERDTSVLNYQVRIIPSKSWIAAGNPDQTTNFFYRMDSCFSIRVNGKSFSPVITQPINNGIANCYEYLLSFNVTKELKGKKLQLVYADRYIDGKKYVLDLNGNQ